MPYRGAMRRRDFVGIVGSVALAPLAARAESMRRIGVLIGNSEGDGQSTQGLVSFRKNLEELGWVEGRNIQIEVRWGRGQLDRIETLVRELVALRPDVLLAHSTPVTVAMQRETRSIPVVFIFVSHPVGRGLLS